MKRQKGITIIELLVSVGIVAIISIVIAQTFFSTTRVNTKIQLIKEIKQNGDFAMHTMVNSIRAAASIQTCSASSTTLTINNTDATQTTFALINDVPSGVNRIIRNGTDYITENSLTLTAGCGSGKPSMEFVCQSQGGDLTKFQIQINFCLTQKGTPPDRYEQASQYFSTTVSNRN